MKPFDWKKALDGEPVVTGNGKEVTDIAYFETAKGQYKIRAVVDGELESYTEKGWWNCDGENAGLDLFMATVQKTRYAIYLPSKTKLMTDKSGKIIFFDEKGEAVQHLIKDWIVVTIYWEE
jgi:hypothetical protein